MHTHIDKANAHAMPAKRATLQFADRRHQASKQKALSQRANNSPQASQMAALQAMADRSLQIPHVAVQRHKQLGADDYALGAPSETESFFTTQSVEPVVSKRKHKEYKIAHEADHSDDRQNLLISDDGSIAINNTAAQAKEFYATDAVFGAAQARLEQADSQVALKKSGELTLTARDQTLSKIVPENRHPGEDERKSEFEGLVSHICIEMATGVMGANDNYEHAAVFKNPDKEGETVTNIKSQASHGDASIGRLATALVDAPRRPDPKAIRSDMLTATSEDLPGKRYGIQAGMGQLDGKARRLGLNQHARPDVGEAYATYSLAAQRGKKIDYIKTGKEREVLKKTWGYHYAAVVAKSPDGKDTVTLENYNRTDDVLAKLESIIDRLINGNKVKFKDIVIAEGSARDKLTQALMVARESSEEEAGADFMKIANSYDGAESWFFAMQGSGKGQSFHEQQVQSDSFENAITLRVRPRNGPREALRSRGTIKIGQFPAPPAWLLAEPGFAGDAAQREAIRAAIANAELDGDITRAVNRGKDQLARLAIDQTIAAISAVAGRSGIENFAAHATGVARQKGITGKLVAANAAGWQAHWDIGDRIDELWLVQVGQRARLTENQDMVLAALVYLGEVDRFYRSA